jgi:hypothetical protein
MLLSEHAERELREILAPQPHWTREMDERDEFVISVGGDLAWPQEVLSPPDRYANKTVETAEPELRRLWRGLVRADATRVLDILALLAANVSESRDFGL